jgi:imidazolonepropionase-like amidohydrolase
MNREFLFLQFATLNAAKQLSWNSRIGTIKKGFYADIIAVDNNIETNIEAILNIRLDMKDGKVGTSKLSL